MTLNLSLARSLPDDHPTPYLTNAMSLEYNDDPTIDPTLMSMESNNHSWGSLDMDPKFPMFNSTDLAFNTTTYGLQNEQSSLSHSSSTSTDPGFNLYFSTFNQPNFSFDMPSAFGFEQFSQPSNFTDFTLNAPHNLLFSALSMATLAFFNASQPSQFSDTSSFMQFQPTTALAQAFPHTGALLPTSALAPVNASPSNAPSPTVIPGNAPQHSIPAPSNASPQPTMAPISLATAPSGASSPPPAQNTVIPGNASTAPVAPSIGSSPPPAQNTALYGAIVQPVHSSTENSTTPLSSLFSNSDSSLSPSVGNPETSTTSLSVPLNQADGHWSGRNPVPSKHHEQINKIDGKGGNKTTAHIEKENTPPNTTPKWTITSHNHLLKSDLGKDWMACVQAWLELEQELGYGTQPGAKVHLWIFLFCEHYI